MWRYDDEIFHHGILGMKWGVQKSKSSYPRKRIAKGFKDSNSLAKTHAQLEDLTRELRSGTKSGNQILVTKGTKKQYGNLMNSYIKQMSIYSKKYSSVSSDVVTEKGRDYIVSILGDKFTGNAYETRIPLRN